MTLIDRAGPRLRLASAVRVDLHELMAQTRHIPDQGSHSTALSGWKELVDGLTQELLPDWLEDWPLLERERWDQLRLHTLESLVEQLWTQERYMAALQTALAAIAIEPVRETAHRLVIELHIAEGNAASALKHYQRYRGLLQRELGVTPLPANGSTGAAPDVAIDSMETLH